MRPFLLSALAIAPLLLTACGGGTVTVDVSTSSKSSSITSSLTASTGSSISTSSAPSGHSLRVVAPEDWYAMDQATSPALARATDGVSISFTAAEQSAVFFVPPTTPLANTRIEIELTPSNELIASGASLDVFYRLGCDSTGTGKSTISASQLSAGTPVVITLNMTGDALNHPRAGKEIGLRAGAGANGTVYVTSTRIYAQSGYSSSVGYDDACYILQQCAPTCTSFYLPSSASSSQTSSQ